MTHGGRKPLSVQDAETVLDWGRETRYPGVRAKPGDVASPSNWDANRSLTYICLVPDVAGTFQSRDLVYAIAEIDRMLRSYGVGVSDGARRAQAAKATWRIETAWRAVLAGDIDDLRQHLAEESATRG